MRTLALLALIVVTTCALEGIALPVAAQSRVTNADLTGTVFDQTRSVLSEARISAVNPDTNLRRLTDTQPDGRFVFRALPPGTYRVTVEARGFATQRRDDIVLTIGSTMDLEFTLALETVAESVTSTAPSPVVDLQQTTLSAVVSRRQIDELPINGRDFLSFSLLTPGVSTDRTPQQGASATSGLTFAGQRARSNNIMVDGLDNNDTAAGSVRAVFSQEAVAEFRVLTGSFSAEFGKASGGIVNIVTRSGTNTRSGNVFFFGRDETLNAKEHFETFDPSGTRIDRGKAPYSQKQFGGTWGGPIIRDRLFYFLSLERLDVRANNFVTINNTDVVSVFDQPVGTTVDILRRAGFPVEAGHVPYAMRSTEFLGKLDQQFRSNQALSIRFNTAANLNENIEPWGGQVAQSRGAFLDSRDVMLAASFTSFLSPNLLNEVRSLVAHRDQNVESLDPTCRGICDEDDEGGPTLEVTGVASVGRHRFTPGPRETLQYQLTDTLSFQRRNHELKGGFDYSYIDHLAGSLPLHFGGRYIFAPLPAIPGVLPAPISAIQAVALGLPAAYVQGYGNPFSGYASQALSGFFQDNWAVRSGLTLRLGLRYQNQYWPRTTYDVRGLPSYSFPSDNNNLAPRLAAAWRPWARRTTSIQAAYGIFYDQHLTSLLGIAGIVDGSANGVRTLVQRFPSSVTAWNSPGRRLPEPPAGTFPSLAITIDPQLRTPYAHHASLGFTQELSGGLSLAASVLYVRGRDQVGTLDYNPVVPALGSDRRPEDEVRSGAPVAGTSSSILQYTSFGETWDRSLTVSLSKRFLNGFGGMASYTIGRAEDNSTDYQSAFLPENTGQGRDRSNLYGLPTGFNPNSEKGRSLQDQRHRLVLSGSALMPRNIQLATIVAVGSGRPYNILAGADLNGDGNGGAFPPDRARRIPTDPSSSIGRNTGTLPAQATVDVRLSRKFQLSERNSVEGMLEVFNLLNRTNYSEINSVFGVGAYPDKPLQTFGQFEKAASPRQAQLAVKITF